MTNVQQTVQGDGNVAIGQQQIATQKNVSGTGNVIADVISAGRDIHVGDIHALSDSHFFEPKLDTFGQTEWVTPPAAHKLVQILIDHHLLILAGDLDDKVECARHLSYLLRKKLEAQGMFLKVRERCQGREPKQIETALQGKDPSILLLVDVKPLQIVGYTPGKLRSLVRQHQCYAILTTDCSRSEWSIDGVGLEPHLWHELSWESYYGRDLLADFLIQKLTVSEKQIPEGALVSNAQGEMLLGGNLPLGIVAERLKSATRVQYFADWLLQQQGPIVLKQIEEQLAQLEGDNDSIAAWYRQFSSHEQLLVLGLTLFDGLQDHLLFLGLELLVETTWRSSDPNLPHFDYQDLTRFSAYFKQINVEGGFFRVQCTPGDRRPQILDLAWKCQRRRLLAALPALTRLIQISAAQGETTQLEEASLPIRVDGQKLYLSKNGTRQLHEALVESLCLIGLLSIDMVKEHFLRLATDPLPGVQQLAARALSAWRDSGHEQELFLLLGSWWEDGTDYEGDEPDLRRQLRADEDARGAVRAAVAVVLGYASRFDRPNRLAQPLHTWLQELVEDKDRYVREAVQSTLSIAVAWHFRQLEPLLRTKVLKFEEFVPAVALGAAQACSMRPEESLAILDGWRTAAKADRRQTSLLLRQRLLATVALTYGYVRCEDEHPLLSPEAIGARLKSMLAQESDPYVRHFSFFAVELQATRNFQLVALILQDLLSHISLPDRPAAVEVFVRTYLHQRQRLPGGDGRVFVNERSYGVWIDSPRPLTEIEAALYSWILDDSRPVAQQLAVDIFEAMAETRLEHEERKYLLSRPSTQRAEPAEPASDRTLPTLSSLPWLARLSVYLAAPRKRQVRTVLRPLMAEFVKVQQRTFSPRATTSSEDVRPVIRAKPKERAVSLLERWTGVANDTTKAVARHLRLALAFYRWRWALVAGALVIALSLATGSRALYRRLTQTAPETAFQAGTPAEQVPIPSPSPTPEGFP